MNKKLKEIKINFANTPYLIIVFIIQLTLSVVIMGLLLIFYDIQTCARNDFLKNYGNKNVIRISDIGNSDVFDEMYDSEHKPDVIDLYTKLNEYNVVIEANQSFTSSYDPKLTDFIISELGNDLYMYKSITVNENYINTNNLKLDSGLLNSFIQFHYEQGSSIPILLGYEYKQYFNIGDKIIGNYFLFEENSEFEIVGFLQKNSKSYNFSSGDYQLLDHYILIPTTIIDSTNALFDRMEMINYSVLMPGIIVEDEDVTNEINDIIKESEYENMYSLQNLNKESEYNYNTYQSIIKYAVFGYLFIQVFSLIILVVSYMKRLAINFNRYAIHLAMGASYKNIAYLIASDLVVIISISNILGLIIFLLYGKILDANFIRLLFLIISLMVFNNLLLYIVIFVCILIKLRKIKLAQFIRRIQS